ncbi:hypothetical protein IW262DRAFT_1477696 [Armillaria fumosa]|nr:hypothetical protein IW262DRAFT_1477696 [Armillaria fumosa]
MTGADNAVRINFIHSMTTHANARTHLDHAEFYVPPSWQQVMSNKFILPPSSWWPGKVCRTDRSGDVDADWYVGYCIESGIVRGFGEVPKDETQRQGELVLKDTNGGTHILNIVAQHTHRIPDGSYALMSTDGGSFNDLWVIGRLREDGKFEKLSVFSVMDYGGGRQLRELGVGKPGVRLVLC